MVLRPLMGRKESIVRRMLPHRLLLLAPMVLLLALQPIGVEATLGWCRTDPVVEIGGKRLHIDVYSLEEAKAAVTGATVLIITVPNGVSTELLRSDDGFGLGWDVRFHRSDGFRSSDRGIEVRASAMVPAGSDLPVKVEMVQRDKVLERETGSTNSWVVAKTWI